MKTILVLTDFTIKDENAVTYALNLAQKVRANVCLCNVYPNLNANMAAGNPVFINEMYESMEQQSINDLNELATRLKKQLNGLNGSWFKPAIEVCSKGGPLTVAINEVIAKENVVMAVIAAHSKDDFFNFINVDHAREIIEDINCPVLVLPYQAKFKDFSKIAFATDLINTNNQAVKSVCKLGRCFNADILIAHVGPEPLGKVTEDYILKRFTNGTALNTELPKIRYQPIVNKNVGAGLDWLADHIDIDLMVMIHRKRNILQKIFERSVTKTMADHLSKPLLIFKPNYNI